MQQSFLKPLIAVLCSAMFANALPQFNTIAVLRPNVTGGFDMYGHANVTGGFGKYGETNLTKIGKRGEPLATFDPAGLCTHLCVAETLTKIQQKTMLHLFLPLGNTNPSPNPINLSTCKDTETCTKVNQCVTKNCPKLVTSAYRKIEIAQCALLGITMSIDNNGTVTAK